ncbi:hypothetical protein B0H16DRAFT_717308 [Mycena metata]|uniref:Secreted protein n=1 Tax=Mycena metata TaxID=1033252 RepID=A0AAD7J6I9_9AGAR|nr:hypothetical protein B0H16DRAFT_717308 [Mycena metata]
MNASPYILCLLYMWVGAPEAEIYPNPRLIGMFLCHCNHICARQSWRHALALLVHYSATYVYSSPFRHNRPSFVSPHDRSGD